MVNIVTKTSTMAQQSQRQQHLKTASSTTEDNHQYGDSKFYSYARHSREVNLVKEQRHRWWQQRRRLRCLQPAVAPKTVQQAPMALLLDYAYLPGMPGVTVELAISGLETIFCCATCCDMNLITVVSCYFQMLFSL